MSCLAWGGSCNALARFCTRASAAVARQCIAACGLEPSGPGSEGGGAPRGATLFSSRLAAWVSDLRDTVASQRSTAAFLGHRGRAFRRGLGSHSRERRPPSVSEPVAGDRSVPGRVPGAAREWGPRPTPAAGAASRPAQMTPHENALGWVGLPTDMAEDYGRNMFLIIGTTSPGVDGSPTWQRFLVQNGLPSSDVPAGVVGDPETGPTSAV
jgi:hypothetical protein